MKVTLKLEITVDVDISSDIHRCSGGNKKENCRIGIKYPEDTAVSLAEQIAKQLGLKFHNTPGNPGSCICNLPQGIYAEDVPSSVQFIKAI
jgi:hypothetical protein